MSSIAVDSNASVHPSLGTRKVLVVEDEGIVALDICESVQGLGYTVVGHTPTGEDAITLVQQLQPDLVLMDVNLAGELDGIESAERIQNATRTPVVFLTAHAEEATLQRAKLLAPHGYIIKPFTADDLRVSLELAFARIDGALESKQADDVSEDLAGHLSTPKEIFSFVVAALNLPGTGDSLQELESSSLAQSVEAGSPVFHAEDAVKGGYVVLSGRLVALQSSPHGKELALELLSPGDVFAFSHALTEVTPTFSVQAQIDSRIVLIPQKTLQSLAAKSPAVCVAILKNELQRLQRLGELALGLAHSRVESRILATLLSLAPRLGKGTQTHESVRLYLTRKDLAELTGTTPETSIRVTKSLERKGLLDLARPGIIKIVSLQALREQMLTLQ